MKRYALIVGGELRNRGAQAMTFRSVVELRDKFPELEPVVVSAADANPPVLMRLLKGKRPRSDADNLTFRIVYGDFSSPKENGSRYRGCAYEPLVDLLKGHAKSAVYHRELASFEQLLNDVALCVDISGFAFGAQWGYAGCARYLTKIDCLHEYAIPTYLLPQSYGPFSFEDQRQTDELAARAQSMLALPRKIYARERQGHNDMLALCPDAKVEMAEDIVVQGRDIAVSKLFRDASLIPRYPGIETSKNVGVVPNVQTVRHGNKEAILKLYDMLIRELLAEGYHVYIIRHSEVDLELCQEIKELFHDEERVALRVEDRYSFQYGELFSRCDFLVASRFHAIVHAFREGTPCVTLGWATKYLELFDRFEMGEYVHDARHLDEEGAAAAMASVREMGTRHSELSDKILVRVQELQAGPSVYDQVASDYQAMQRLA